MRLTQRESQMEEQAARIKSIHQEDSTAIWVQLLEKEGAVVSIPRNEGRIVQVWVTVRGGMRLFCSIYLAHGIGAETSQCDANMSPEDFEKSLSFRKDQMHVIAPEGVSTCR